MKKPSNEQSLSVLPFSSRASNEHSERYNIPVDAFFVRFATIPAVLDYARGTTYERRAPAKLISAVQLTRLCRWLIKVH